MNSASKIYSLNIDLLSRKGIKFMDANSNSAVCTSSRYMMLSRRLFFKAGKEELDLQNIQLYNTSLSLRPSGSVFQPDTDAKMLIKHYNFGLKTKERL